MGHAWFRFDVSMRDADEALQDTVQNLGTGQNHGDSDILHKRVGGSMEEIWEVACF